MYGTSNAMTRNERTRLAGRVVKGYWLLSMKKELNWQRRVVGGDEEGRYEDQYNQLFNQFCPCLGVIE